MKYLILIVGLLAFGCNNPCSCVDENGQEVTKFDSALVGSWEGNSIAITFGANANYTMGTTSGTCYTDNAGIYFSDGTWCYYKLKVDFLILNFFNGNSTTDKWDDYALNRVAR